MKKSQEKQLPVYEPKCAHEIAEGLVIAIDAENHTVIQGTNAMNGEPCIIELGRGPDVLIQIVGYLQHLVEAKEHHGLTASQILALMAAEQAMEVKATHEGNGHVH